MNWAQLRDAHKPVVLYGMGNGGDLVMEQLRLHGIRPAGVFASAEFVRGQTFHDLPVTTYEAAKAAFGEMIVLVAFGTARTEVLARIDAIASEQDLYVPDFPVAGGERFTPEFARSHRAQLQWVYDRLADEASRRVMEDVVSYKLSGRPELLHRCASAQEDAYRQLLQLGTGEILVDLGAYRGDTAAEFCRWAPDYEAIYAVEPDDYSFRKLTQQLSGLARCTCIHAAIGAQPGTTAFTQKGGRGSKAAQTGKLIPLESVDHILGGRRASFLNIDVEGSEAQAIAGAAQTIGTWKPKILLAAYHRSSDLFALPQQVLQLQPDYRLYLRKHPGVPAWDVNFYLV